jgi:predicted permease
MTPTPKLPSGVRRLFRFRWSRAHIARDLDDELRFHLEMRMSELESSGLTTPEARAEALRRLGDVEDLRAYCMRTDEHRARVARVGDWIMEWRHDFQLALRQFRRAPAFSALAVLTLALGIGANTAIFSVVHALLLDPLPYTDGNRIVGLRQEAGDGDMRFPVDGDALQLWSERARSLEDFSAASTGRGTTGAPADADTTATAVITPSFVATLKLHPRLGRAFTVDDLRGDQSVAMISHSFWKARFAGSQDVIGTVLRVNGRPRTIIGVMPPRAAVPFTHGPLPDVWLPVDLDHLTGSANGFARLRPGVTPEAASRELQAILAESPDASRYAKTRARAMRSQEFLDGKEVRTIQVLFVAVGVLLLIACANVANLLLARSWTRRREFAIRAALGAGRGRLVRQVLTESTTLALVAGGIGVLVASEGLRLIVGLRPPSLVDLADIHLEPAVLGWSAFISVATGMLFGSIPALVSGSLVVNDALRSGGHATGSVRRAGLRSGLVVLEVALSVMLLIGSALLIRSFVALQRMHLGYEPHNLVSIGAFFRGEDVARRSALRDAALERLRALPAVEEAAVGNLPGQAWTIASPIEADGNGATGVTAIREFTTTFISPAYFRAAGIAILGGRTLDSSLTRASVTESTSVAPSEVVINATLAKKLWPNGNAIGGRLRTNSTAPWSTVVGIVDDIRMPGVSSSSAALQMYSLPTPRIPGFAFVIRARTSPTALMPSLRRAIAAGGPDISVGSAMNGDDYLRDSLAPSRFAMALLGAFALIALVLSAIGLYGVIAYAVSQRTREIGVRVALGANAGAVARLIVGNGLRLTLMGVTLGVAGAFVTSRSLESILYGVTPLDPFSFAAIPLLIGTIALLASYVPTRRALRIDPVEALRAE